MKKVNCAVFLFAALFCFPGCATIVSGTTQKVSVTSQPSGAKVTADGKMTAITPTEFTLERKTGHILEFSKEGYKNATVLLKQSMNGMGFGNVLLGGIIGIGVDAVSGADWKLVPERVDLALEPGQGLSESPKFIAKIDQDFYDKNISKPYHDVKQGEEKGHGDFKKEEEPKKPAIDPAANFIVKPSIPASPKM